MIFYLFLVIAFIVELNRHMQFVSKSSYRYSTDCDFFFFVVLLLHCFDGFCFVSFKKHILIKLVKLVERKRNHKNASFFFFSFFFILIDEKTMHKKLLCMCVCVDSLN